MRSLRNEWNRIKHMVAVGEDGTHPPRARAPIDHAVVGADVGVNDLPVVASPDGAEVARIAAPQPLARSQSRLRAAQRQAARRCGPGDRKTQTTRAPT